MHNESVYFVKFHAARSKAFASQNSSPYSAGAFELTAKAGRKKYAQKGSKFERVKKLSQDTFSCVAAASALKSDDDVNSTPRKNLLLPTSNTAGICLNT